MGEGAGAYAGPERYWEGKPKGLCKTLGGGYEAEVAAEMEGDVCECRTRLTSVSPSAFQRSTVRTKKEVSILLEDTDQLSILLVIGCGCNQATYFISISL